MKEITSKHILRWSMTYSKALSGCLVSGYERFVDLYVFAPCFTQRSNLSVQTFHQIQTQLLLIRVENICGETELSKRYVT